MGDTKASVLFSSCRADMIKQKINPSWILQVINKPADMSLTLQLEKGYFPWWASITTATRKAKPSTFMSRQPFRARTLTLSRWANITSLLFQGVKSHFRTLPHKDLLRCLYLKGACQMPFSFGGALIFKWQQLESALVSAKGVGSAF